MARGSVNDLKIRIQAALEGKTTFKETSALLKDISDKLKDTKQSSSNFRLLAKEYEKVNEVIRKQGKAVDEVLNKEKNLATIQKQTQKERDRTAKLEEAANKKRAKEIDDLAKAEKRRADQLSATQRKEAAQNLIRAGKQEFALTGKAGSLNQLKEQIKTVTQLRDNTARGTAEWQRYNARLNDLKGVSNTSTVSLTAMGGAIGIIATVAVTAVAGLLRMSVELAKIIEQGAELNVLNNAFNNIEGGVSNATGQLQLLQKAGAGNLDNATIKEFNNEFRLLGNNSEAVVQFFDVAETRSDMFRGNMKETLTALQTFIETGNRKGAIKLKFDVAEVEKKMAELGKTTVDNLSKFSMEDQQRLRSQAIIALYGHSIDDIKEKKMDEADAVKSLFTMYENLKQGILQFIASAAAPLIEKVIATIKYVQDLFATLETGDNTFSNLLKSVVRMVQQGFMYLMNTITSKIIPAWYRLTQAIRDYIRENPQTLTILKALIKLLNDLWGIIISKVINAFTNFVKIAGALSSVLNIVQSAIGKVYSWLTQSIEGTWLGKVASWVIDVKNQLMGLVSWVNSNIILKSLFGVGGMTLSALTSGSDQVTVNDGTTEQDWADNNMTMDQLEKKQKSIVDKQKREQVTFTPSGSNKGGKNAQEEKTETEDRLALIKLILEEAEAENKVNSALLNTLREQTQQYKDQLNTEFAGNELTKKRIEAQRFINDLSGKITDIQEKDNEAISKGLQLQAEQVTKWKEVAEARRQIDEDLNLKKQDFAADVMEEGMDKEIARVNLQIEREIMNFKQLKDVTEAQVDIFKRLKVAEQQHTTELIRRNQAMKLSEGIISVSNTGFETFYQILNNKGNIGEGFKGMLKSVLTSMLNFAEGMIIAAKAASIAKSIATLGIFAPATIAEIAILLGELAAIQTGKALIGTLAVGTRDWGGGPALVGEQGPEIVNLPKHAQVLPTAQTMKILNSNIVSGNPAVTSNNFYRIDVNKGEIYEEGKRQFERYKRAIR